MSLGKVQHSKSEVVQVICSFFIR